MIHDRFPHLLDLQRRIQSLHSHSSFLVFTHSSPQPFSHTVGRCTMESIQSTDDTTVSPSSLSTTVISSPHSAIVSTCSIPNLPIYLISCDNNCPNQAFLRVYRFPSYRIPPSTVLLQADIHNLLYASYGPKIDDAIVAVEKATEMKREKVRGRGIL